MNSHAMQVRVLRVGVHFLTPKTRSVIESILFLLERTATDKIIVASGAVDVELFDRVNDMQAFLSADNWLSTKALYLRGFEPFALASSAHAVIDRPIRPAVLHTVLQRFAAEMMDHDGSADLGLQAPVRSMNADELLELLAQQRSSAVLKVNSSTGDEWHFDAALQTVHGSRLHPPAAGHAAVSFDVSDHPGMVPTARPLAFDQWVYWIARQSSGDKLRDHAETAQLQVQRAAVSAADGRDFVRLAAIFLRPTTIAQAHSLGQTDLHTVRRFLNANSVLGRLAGTPSAAVIHAGHVLPVSESINRPVPDAVPRATGLFGRLLNRIFTGHGNVR